jgi:hypothetical protein
VRGFLSRHHSHTPLFTELGREFIGVPRIRSRSIPHAPGCRNWRTTNGPNSACRLSDAVLPPHDPERATCSTACPLLSPLAWPLAYRWPVHRIGPGFQPTDPPATNPRWCCCAARPTGEVHFSMLSPLLFRLLERVGAERGETGRALLERLAIEADQSDVDAFIGQAVPMLLRLRDEGVLLGTCRSS